MRKPLHSPVRERRVGGSAGWGRLRRWKGMLFRPIGLQRRDGRLRIGLVERRHAADADAAPGVPSWWQAVREYLLVQEDAQLAEVARHLNSAVDELGRGGWRGVKALPHAVLAQAEMQARLVDSSDAPPAFQTLIEGLHKAAAAAARREAQPVRLKTDAADSEPEVSEASAEEFDAAQHDAVEPVDRPGKPRSG